MKDWNVVVTVFDGAGYRAAYRILSPLGQVDRTAYFNVLVMKVEDIGSFAERFAGMVETEPGLLNDISRLMPAHATFDFETSEAFADKARDIVLGWSERLAGGSFYVRLHRRGFRGSIVSPEEERFLDGAILKRLDELNRPGRVDFADPDHVIDIETVDTRAGLSLWTRDDLARLEFLHID